MDIMCNDGMISINKNKDIVEVKMRTKKFGLKFIILEKLITSFNGYKN